MAVRFYHLHGSAFKFLILSIYFLFYFSFCIIFWWVEFHRYALLILEDYSKLKVKPSVCGERTC